MYTVGVAPLVKVYDLKHCLNANLNFSLDICVVLCYTVTTIKERQAKEIPMAKKHRDVLQMQLDMLVKTKRYNELNPVAPTRRASGEVVTDPKTGKSYKVVG